MPPTRFKPRAEWIWRERGVHAVPFGTPGFSAEDERNRYIYFRREFTVEDNVQSAQVHTSADGRYQLYVNSKLVGRGPARCNTTEQQVDPYDLRPYLQPGPNVIAALVHSYGQPTAWYEPPLWEHKLAFGCGGFFLQGDVVMQQDGRETVQRLDTNASWRHLVSEAWKQDAPSGSLGFLELFDTRLAPVGWSGIEFNAADWTSAEVLRVPGRHFVNDITPFTLLTERDIPPLFEEERWPEAVLLVGEVKNAAGVRGIASRLEAEPLVEPDACQVQEIDQAIVAERLAEISTTPGRSVSVVLDFGRTVSGRVRFDVDAPAGAMVDFTYSERLQEDGRVLMHKGIPGFDERPAHQVILREGRQSWEAFEWAGFRYLQLTFRHCLQPLRVHGISLNFTSYPVQERGRFSCSDDLLNRIWQTGAYTLQLCMQDAYIDCPSREQRQWMGDAYVQVLINFMSFGDARLAARLLRQIAQSQRPDGILMMCAPGDFAIGKFINIPDFSLYWLMTLGRYVEYSGDISLASDLYPTILKLLSWFEQFLDNDLLTDMPHWVFIDWSNLDKQGQVTALNAQFVAALRAAAHLAILLDHPADADRWHVLADRVATVINEQLWDDKRGVYVDARRQDGLSRRVSQQTNAAVIAFDVAPPERWERILNTIMDTERLVLTRVGEHDLSIVAFDEEHDVVRAQPFYSHHLHRALSKAGRQMQMVGNIRRRWGEMIEKGAQSWRETWQIDDLTSLSHAWAGTPTFDLSTEILGITPTSPGFSTFRVAPRPVDLTWAKGAVPTPQGDIEVAWRKKDATFTLKLNVPTNTRAEVFSPFDGSSLMCEEGTHELDFPNDRL
ncbi:MAG: family 78 glycoside hydrolase catalytic domain [Chloroflexota bacterium]|nr:family 78 glycoside hydrolase catalytic domain [Chloroflexota bacterium]